MEILQAAARIQAARSPEAGFVSAPVTRDTPALSTGKPAARIHLSIEERQLAAQLGISEVEYARQKARMNREKALGLHQTETS